MLLLPFLCFSLTSIVSIVAATRAAFIPYAVHSSRWYSLVVHVFDVLLVRGAISLLPQPSCLRCEYDDRYDSDAGDDDSGGNDALEKRLGSVCFAGGSSSVFAILAVVSTFRCCRDRGQEGVALTVREKPSAVAVISFYCYNGCCFQPFRLPSRDWQTYKQYHWCCFCHNSRYHFSHPALPVCVFNSVQLLALRRTTITTANSRHYYRRDAGALYNQKQEHEIRVVRAILGIAIIMASILIQRAEALSIMEIIITKENLQNLKYKRL